jgi:hypothetical protein
MLEHNRNFLIGGIIILIGILALLANLGVLDGIQELVGSIFFFVVAYLFFNVYKKQKANWWALIPATFCAALGIIILLENFSSLGDEWSGTILFWSGALIFGFFYVKDNKKWWAVIPAGTLFTLGAIVLIDEYNWLNNGLEGSVLFLGLGLTFIFLYLQRNAENKLGWAIWPGGILSLFALFVYFQNVNWLDEDFIFPAILILVGGFLIFKASKKK